MGNSVVVAGVQMVFEQLIAPRLAACLARIKHGYGTSFKRITSENEVCVHLSQA